jgi:hypothetical protein
MATNLSQTTEADWNAINRRLVQRVREKASTLDAEGVAAEAVATMSERLATGQVSDPLAVAMSICDGLIRNGRRRAQAVPIIASDFNRFGDEDVEAVVNSIEEISEPVEIDASDITETNGAPRFYTRNELDEAVRRLAAENFWRTSGREWDSEVREDFEHLIVGLNGPRVVVTGNDLQAVRALTAELHALLALAEQPSEPGCVYPVRDWAKKVASRFLLENLDSLAQWGRGSLEESESAARRMEALVYALDEHDYLGTGKPADTKDLAYVAILLGWAASANQTDDELRGNGLTVDGYLAQITLQIDAARAKYGYAVRETISRWRCKREDFDRMRAKTAR